MEMPDLQPLEAQLWQKIYSLPAKYGFKHEHIMLMIPELIQMLVSEICGDQTSILFGEGQIADRLNLPPQEWLPNSENLRNSHTGRPCARKLLKGEPTHRCLTCGLDDTCVLCKYCYNPTEHEGHNVFVKISSRDDGGICDCGDSEAWTRQLHCLCDQGATPTAPLSPQFINRAKIVLGVMTDFITDVLAGATVAEEEIALPEIAEKLHDELRVKPTKRGIPDVIDPQNQWCLLIYDEDRKSLMDLHSTLQKVTDRSESFLKMIEKRIQKIGRACIATDTSPEKLLAQARKCDMFPMMLKPLISVIWEEMAEAMVQLLYDFTQCHLLNTDPTALIALVGEALLESWQPGVDPQQNSASDTLGIALSKLVNYRMPTEHEEHSNLSCFLDMYSSEMPRPQDAELFGANNYVLEACYKLTSSLQSKNTQNYDEVWADGTKSRVSYLMFFDVKLHKKLRQNLIDLYVASLVSNTKLKMQFAQMYAAVYPRLVVHHALIDNHPQIGVCTELSPQLFTTPSVATMLMEQCGLEVYMGMLFNLYTQGDDRLNPGMFKNRRINQTFSELIPLMVRNTKPETVSANGDRLVIMARFLSLFQGIAPMSREKDEHVLYESERWVYWFTSIPFFLQMAKIAVGGLFDVDSRDVPISSIATICQGLADWEANIRSISGKNAIEHEIYFQSVKIPGTKSDGVDAENFSVSILNPMHAYVGWILEYAQINNYADLEAMLGAADYDAMLLFDAPMDTLGILAQIAAGLWVRNGTSAKYQLVCYREALLRDLAFSEDIFMTQVAFAVANPNSVFYNLMVKFGIEQCYNSNFADSAQRSFLMDEFLHCVTALFSDRIRLHEFDDKHEFNVFTIAQELIQLLWFDPLPYSEIVGRVPECIATADGFDSALEMFTDFTPPSGTHGVGLYSLKPSLYAKFDPQYTYFNLARIEEAERLMVGKNARFMDPQSAVHTPPLLKLKPQFQKLPQFGKCLMFAKFTESLLVEFLETPKPETEQSLNRLVYLMILVAKDEIEHPESQPVQDLEHLGVFSSITNMVTFCGQLNSTSSSDSQPILYYLNQILATKKYPPLSKKIDELMRLMNQLNSAIPYEQLDNSVNDSCDKEQLERKARAKEMQAKVLADFSRQQQQFMNSSNYDANSDVDDMSDDLGDPSEGYTFHKNCVLCRMSGGEDSVFGILTFTSNNKILRKLPTDSEYWMSEAYKDSSNLDVEHQLPAPTNPQNGLYGPAFPSEFNCKRTVVQGCGHGVHFSCFKSHLDSEQSQRNQLFRFTAENHLVGEFLCPLCKGINDCFMPILSTKNSISNETFLTRSKPPAAEEEELELLLNPQVTDIDRSEVVFSCSAHMDEVYVKAMMGRNSSSTLFSTVQLTLLDQMLKTKSTKTGSDSSENIFGLSDIYQSFAGTIELLEVSMRGVKHHSPFGGLVLDQLNPRTVEFLRIFVQYLYSITCYLTSKFIRLQPRDFYNVYSLLSSENPLASLVELLILFGPGKNIQGSTILRVCAVVEIQKVLANLSNYQFPSQRPNTDVDPEVAKTISQYTDLDPALVYGILEYQMTVIYRQYALVVFAICGAYDADQYCGIMHLPEHERLAAYLNLPTLAETLINMGNDHTFEYKTQTLVSNYLVPQLKNKANPLVFPNVYNLLSLPTNLETLFEIPVQSGSPTNAICLVCGETCGVQDYEAVLGTPGPCNMHLKTCSVNQGVFFLPRRNHILLLRSCGRGTFIPAPYLDTHGETDESMRRGKPHFLQPARYFEFTRDVWLKNALPSLVARRLDQSQDHGGWETL